MSMPTAPRSSPLALTVLALLHYQPLHPYGIQRLIKQWGKDQVVNVEQRTSLYRTIERLLAAGLIGDRGAVRACHESSLSVLGALADQGRRRIAGDRIGQAAEPEPDLVRDGLR